MASSTSIQGGPFLSQDDAPDIAGISQAISQWAEIRIVMTFDSANARSEAFTLAKPPVTPIEGSISYLRDVNRYDYYDGTAWRSLRDLLVGTPLTYSGRVAEPVVASGDVSKITLSTPDSSYYTTAGVVKRSGMWALTLQVSATNSTGDIPVGGAILTPTDTAPAGWDGRIYTGHWVDWNSTTHSSASWTGYMKAGQSFGFFRANHDSQSRFIETVYTVSFITAS